MGGGCALDGVTHHDQITLAHYLKEAEAKVGCPSHSGWYAKLGEKVQEGKAHFESCSNEEKVRLTRLFEDWVRTEELKAWYGEPENGSLFQGTSVSSLTIPAEYDAPLEIRSVQDLEEAIADQYIEQHDRYEADVKNAIMEDTSKWRHEGLYYGVVVASKLLSQAFDLSIKAEDAVFEVDGVVVDPHEITTYPAEIREKYFEQCLERIDCFADIPNLTQAELESSLVLADISKPKIEKFDQRILLGPIRCNEICTVISEHVCDLIEYKSGGRIHPRSLQVTIYDTDTPYTYNQIMGYYGREMSPSLPGLVVLGSSGTIDAFRWLYAYRVSLLSQKIMKSSLYSEVAKRFIPFVYFGVLVERDAEILLEMDNLSKLRYPGNISPFIEFAYLIPKLVDYVKATSDAPYEDDLKKILIS
ncbi:MAG: hypothetical protein OQK24_01445 [Magnetovibrio sp.]|nr:hypothetical protein [Magnetovibrio sp.]